MKVVTLLENRTISKELDHKHGLSLYIETSNHRILFDTGKDESFIKNAEKMGIDLTEIDIAIISHGHYDHGGGLEAFMKVNLKAKIYIGKDAFRKHLYKFLGIFKFNIGVNKGLRDNRRFVFVEDIMKIDDELLLFGKVNGDKLLPEGNKKLLASYDTGSIGEDDFSHEISLVIHEENKYTLFCGCAHRGIVNIIVRSKDIIKNELNTVIGGMHLKDMKIGREKDKEYLNELVDILSSNAVKSYYTCHCTGDQIYNYLKPKMSNLNEIKTGMSIEV